MKVVIVGAGFGGLSVAALLAKNGFNVTVLEKNEQIGGRASIHKDKGFTFDMGPSWYLMPDVFEKFFAEFDRKTEDLFKLIRLDPSYRIFFSKEKIVDVYADIEQNYNLFDKLEKNGAEKLKKYLKLAEQKYEISMDGLIYKDFKSIFDFLSWKLLIAGSKLSIFKKLDTLVNEYFDSDEARKIMEYSIGFLGGSPKITPAVYQLISYVDFALGVWFPKGGMGKVAKVIYDLAKSYGAKFRFNEEVKKIEIEDKKATKVITDKDEISADIFIINADYPHTELNLIENKYQTYPQKYWDKKIFAPSAFVAYIGIDKQIDKLLHHTLFLDRDWARNFDEIFDSKQKTWPKTPSYYVNVPSKTDPDFAPKGGETLFILVPLAPDLEDTEELREKFYNQIMDNLEEMVGENIREHVVSKRIFAVNDFRDRYNAYKGTALSLVHTLRQTALWRPRHKSKKVKNLYYTGQYTHPGIGVPMTLISSQIISDIITKEYE
jgi:phytoene desaturase